VRVETFGTAKLGISDEQITDAVQRVFSFKPADIVNQLNLLHPIYRQTTNYGHFGKHGLPWEETNKAAALRAAIRH
jgi:S-adenosylmethionine synthetase